MEVLDSMSGLRNVVEISQRLNIDTKAPQSHMYIQERKPNP